MSCSPFERLMPQTPARIHALRLPWFIDPCAASNLGFITMVGDFRGESKARHGLHILTFLPSPWGCATRSQVILPRKLVLDTVAACRKPRSAHPSNLFETSLDLNMFACRVHLATWMRAMFDVLGLENTSE
jgi:hypothetical protein